jgi:hypothetical protein
LRAKRNRRRPGCFDARDRVDRQSVGRMSKHSGRFSSRPEEPGARR